ncbi:3-hydroxyisobutyrate dehydrogenase [Fusarium mundagurra]|uniref:3-hydroxyisobutyrate dehydrogenase n=1 Tax=Fusarium mundagurra TaxID=1567541 RepID=A0A8H5XSI3_9HYPO|nr:3-hydroxyisobutyrate dehydrogenase [Fusarium mundagurra]
MSADKTLYVFDIIYASFVSMVPGLKEVRTVYMSDVDGIIAGPESPDKILIDCSTVDIKTAKEVVAAIMKARRDQEQGAHAYRCFPRLQGGVPAAEQQTLSFMVGHAPPRESLDDPSTTKMKRIFSMMGDPAKLFWCGALGTGLAAKISNNYISCSVLLLVTEAMATGTRLGVDPKLLHQIIQNSTGQTWMNDNVCPIPGVVDHAPSSNNWQLGFKTPMFIKDISLGVDAARQAGIEPTMASAALSVYKRAAVNPLCIDRDGSSV